MPKAPVNLDDLVQAREHKIGSAGKLLDMEPVSKAHSMDKPAHGHLRRRIPAADSPHVLASNPWRQPVQIQAAPRASILAWIAFA